MTHLRVNTETRMKLNRTNQRAFTLVEIMIVVATIGMLAAMAIPNFVHARTVSRRSVCIANLKTLQDTKTQWAFELKKGGTETPVEADLFGSSNYLREKPACPGGGDDYLPIIGTVNERATCTLGPIEGHSL